MTEAEAANSLLLQWVKEWLDEAKERNTKGATAYKKAYDSLKMCPVTFHHPSELKCLKGFGEKLCQRLTEKMIQHCRENGLPTPSRTRAVASLPQGLPDPGQQSQPSQSRRSRKSKLYVPRLRSGAYALLLALGSLEADGKSCLSKKELIAAAEPHCDESFTVARSANGYYTAWSCMKTLVAKELVIERGRPIKRYALTDEGLDVAKNLKATVDQGGDCRNQATSRHTSNCSENSNCSDHDDSLDDSRKDRSAQARSIGSDDVVEIDSSSFNRPAPATIGPNKRSQQLPHFSASKQNPERTILPSVGADLEINSSTHTGVPSPQDVVPIRVCPGAFTIHLILDSREVRAKKDRDYMQSELEKKGIKPITRPLPLGDFLWVAKLNNPNLLAMNRDSDDEVVLDYIVERKRLDDLIQSIRETRFREQKFRLWRSGIQNVIYLVEQLRLDSEVWQKNEKAVESALASTQVVDKYFVKRTQTTDDTIRYIARLTKRLKARYEQRPLYVLPGRDITPQTYLQILKTLREQESLKPMPKSFYLSYHSFESLSSKSESLMLRDVFLKMLMCTKGVDGEKALGIQSQWKTPIDFIEAYEKCGFGEAGLKRKREMIYEHLGHMAGRRKVGKTISQNIAEVWAGKS